jgi:hypothetical protein
LNKKWIAAATPLFNPSTRYLNNKLSILKINEREKGSSLN